LSREIPNELEERRVIRLLAGAAESVPPLHGAEVGTLVRLAAASVRAPRSRRHSSLRRPQLLATATVAAAAVLALTLPVGQHEPERRSPPTPAGLAAHTVTFPEGSALSLLLSRPSEKRA
jgi:hypothetical protein